MRQSHFQSSRSSASYGASQTHNPLPRDRGPFASAWTSVSPPRLCLAAGLAVSLGACGGARMAAPVTPESSIRVVASAGTASSLDAITRQTAQYDVVFFGEEHTDPATHRVEFELLQTIGRTGRPVVLSLEMFERDIQVQLDAYLRGGITEADFLAQSRPWARYGSDYRALVELAKAKGWPVVAANVPRPLASAVGRHGLAALDSLSGSERVHAATDIDCPDDDYRRRFFEEMKGHSSGGAAPSPSDTLPTAVAQRFYYAQCVKDETMAESIVAARQRATPGAVIVHYDGSFHSDFGAGTAARVRRRDPAARVLVITAIPVPDPLTATVVAPTRADVTIFTKATPDSSAKR